MQSHLTQFLVLVLAGLMLGWFRLRSSHAQKEKALEQKLQDVTAPRLTVPESDPEVHIKTMPEWLELISNKDPALRFAFITKTVKQPNSN
jgi:hypothetical protein